MQPLEVMEEEDHDHEDDVSPKGSLRRNGSFICVAAPFVYDKLPEEPLKLTILKLDGSSFDIQVDKNGTVEDLKQAVQEAFSDCKVSWIHVWGHFCLAYQDQKLLADDDLIGTHGIKDGDQLSFVRREKAKSEDEDRRLDESGISDGFDKKMKKAEDEDIHAHDSSENDENMSSEDEDESDAHHRLFHLFKGLFSYQKLAVSSESGTEDEVMWFHGEI